MKMENRPIIKKEQVETVYDSRFIKVFDLQYEPGKHYFDATRRSIENLAAVKNDEEFKQMLPDAVSCVVILKISGQEPRLCLSREYRYPAGQFLLSVPAGLLDPEDAAQENPVFHAAIRELREETGIALEESDSIRLSTPGMTDESNALVQITLNREEMPKVSQEGAVGTECFDGFLLLTREEAQKILKDGVDDQALFYPLYTWAALMCFVTGMWE
jgi:ADP-ribose pyrophosphatase